MPAEPERVDPPPLSIPPPPPVSWAAVGLLAQAAGLVALGVAVAVSGMGDGHVGPALAQTCYFVVLALFVAAVGTALLRGRRWGRTPAVVLQILTAAIGLWLAFPGDHLGWGVALTVFAVVIGFLLLSAPAHAWILQFPTLFGPDPVEPPASGVRSAPSVPPNRRGRPGRG